MNYDFLVKKRIIIKVGSSLLVSDGFLREKWLNNFAQNVAQLVSQKIEIVIVTSGAIALGRGLLKNLGQKLSLEEKQAAAAAGQIQLMSFYRDFFKKCNLEVAQILLTASDCNARKRYLNCKNTIATLLKNGIIPIINENDSVAVDEIKIGDNDRLAARVAQMTDSDLMILFSDIDGLFEENPKINKKAKFISEVKKITKEIESLAGGAGSVVGTGGMVTKILAAKMVALTNCDTVITNGFEENALGKLFAAGSTKKFTIFYGKKQKEQSFKHITKARQKWLSGFVNAKGEVVINQKACETLCSKKVSLLPVGVVAVKGKFEKGEAIFIKDEKGNHVASGISNYDSLEVKKILQKNSREVTKILGPSAKSELVHIDNLILVS